MAIKCVNCGKVVEPRISGGQIALGMFLLLFYVVPGVLYFCFCSKHKCPACNQDVYIKNNY